MLKRPRRFLAMTMVVVAICLYWGCTQPDDIVLDKSQSFIYLQPERLPSNPQGMVYELWVVDELDDEDTDQVLQGAQSIGRFGYDFGTRVFLTENGTERADSNQFILAGDILTWGYLAVTVQNTVTPDIGPGPVMLIDTIVQEFNGDILLKFPLVDSMYNSILFYNMKIVSLDSPDENDFGSAIWFNTVNFRTEFYAETLSLDSFTIDTIYIDSIGDEPISSPTNFTNIEQQTIYRHFGLDSLSQRRMNYEPSSHIAEPCCPDSTDTTSGTSYWLTTDVDFYFTTTTPVPISFDDHIQIGEALPLIGNYGWQYEGWVVSPLIEAAGASLGDMTMPAWTAYTNPTNPVLVGIDGGLFSTGTFDSITGPDDGNPNSSTEHAVPPFPGEDFLFNLPNIGNGPVNLVDGSEANGGSAFISLQPSNAVDNTTNFPLIIMTGILPTGVLQVQADSQSFAMWNRSSYTRGSLVGMPRVKAVVNRM